MSSNPPGYYTKKFKKLREEFGGKCQDCGNKNRLEFAHTKPTGLNGWSRGMPQRYHNIKNNLDSYKLLCRSCHQLFEKYGDEVPF